MAGFDNDVVYGSNVDFRGTTPIAAQVVADGQLLIGATAAPNIRVATLTAGAGITITNGAGAITIAAMGGLTPIAGLIPDAHTAPGTTPVVGDGSGNVTITGAQVASGVVGTNVIRTDSLAANTMTIEIQRATTAAASTPADNGVAHFDSAIFTVGAGGFVSLVGGGIPPTQKVSVDAFTAPGTNPVVPTAGGIMTVTGAQVAAGVVGTNVIRTDSLAANTYTIEIQRSTTAAVSTPADNGVSHFDSAIFTVGAAGFVSLVGGSVPPAQKFAVDASTVPGTNPVVPTAGGVVTITGAQVATGTIGANVIRTNSVAANAYRIEVQRTTAVAASDSTKNGVAHFNSAQFTVDANGFTSLNYAAKPAFLAVLRNTVPNVTGNGAVYQIIYDTEIFDQHNDFNLGTSTFTAPFTGLYFLQLQVRIIGKTTANDYICQIVTTQNTFTNRTGPPALVNTDLGWNVSVLANMNAGDTATYFVQVLLNGANNMSIEGALDNVNFASGYQVA